MDQLIEAFGIDTRLILVQVLNFTILVVVLTYFLYRPILALLAKREEKIKQGIKDAEAAAAARSNAETEKGSIISAANVEAGAVVARATSHASHKAEEIIGAASEKAVGIVSAAESAGRTRAEQLLKESEAEISKVAILAAEKILRQSH